MKTPVEKVKEYQKRKDDKYKIRREKCFKRIYKRVLKALARKEKLHIRYIPYIEAELETYLENKISGLFFRVRPYHNKEHITWWVKKGQ
jgi:hypothetical protein